MHIWCIEELRPSRRDMPRAIPEWFELSLVVAKEDEPGAEARPAAHGPQRGDGQQAHLVDQEPGVRQRLVEVQKVRHLLAADQPARAVRVGADADLLFKIAFICLSRTGFPMPAAPRQSMPSVRIASAAIRKDASDSGCRPSTFENKPS